MCDKDIVTRNPRLRRAITNRAPAAVACVTGGKRARIVAEDTAAPGLVKGDPVSHLRPERLEDEASVMCKVSDEFLLVQEAAVAPVQLLGKIPMEQCDHRRDARGEQVVHELDIELQAFFVDWVIAPAQGDNSGPRFPCQSRLSQDMYKQTMRSRIDMPEPRSSSIAQCPRGFGDTSRRRSPPIRHPRSCRESCKKYPRSMAHGHLH